MARVRLFANLREMAGTSHAEVEGGTVGEVAAALSARYGPDFDRRMQAARIWKNGEEAVASDPVSEADELAVIPPVSGGAAPQMGGALESVFLAALAAALLAANALGPAALAAVWVGAAALWVLDLTHAASDGDFRIDYGPLLAAVLVSVTANAAWGVPGLGIGVAASSVMVMGWTVIRPRARDLTTMAASVLCALLVSLATGSVLLARASTAGGSRIAGFLIIVAAGVLVGRVAERRSQVMDPYMVTSVITVLTALAVAYLWDFDLLSWFFIGLVLAAAMFAGRGIGAAFRTGHIRLSVRPDGTLTGLDSPMAAAAVFMPILWLVS